MANYIDGTTLTAYSSRNVKAADILVMASETLITAACGQATDIVNRLNYWGSPLTSEVGDNAFPRDWETIVSQEILDAVCLIALALIDGLDPDEDIDGLRQSSTRFEQVSVSYSDSVVPQHLYAGVPSGTAWQLLAPYLAGVESVNINRVS
jgi:hypothetical protein